MSLGITPAYAGKSTQRAGTYGYGGDHPRLCGEKLSAEPDKRRRRGSPPPMRGKANPDSPGAQAYRITPAYAGKRGNIPLSFMTL